MAGVQKIALQNEIDRNATDSPSPIVDKAKSTKVEKARSTKIDNELTLTPAAAGAPKIFMDKLVWLNESELGKDMPKDYAASDPFIFHPNWTF